MKVGYVRVSTVEQNEAIQLTVLEETTMKLLNSGDVSQKKSEPILSYRTCHFLTHARIKT